MSENELVMLKWLGESDYSQYGECYGPALDKLIDAGLAQIHARGEHQVFIARGNDIMYRAVSLTEAGRNALAQSMGEQS